MKVRALHDLLIKRLKEEECTKGGIVIPDTAKGKLAEGKVVAVGNGKILQNGKTRRLDLKGGNRVLLSKYASTDVTIDWRRTPCQQNKSSFIRRHGTKALRRE